MRKLVGKRLPEFTKNEKEMLKGSTDFIGINYYYSRFVRQELNRTKITTFDNFDALAITEGKFLIKLNSIYKKIITGIMAYKCIAIKKYH